MARKMGVNIQPQDSRVKGWPINKEHTHNKRYICFSRKSGVVCLYGI